jgi:hypothetical protein
LDVPNSKGLLELIEKGDLSIRPDGIGNTIKQPDGTDLIQDDYQLEFFFLTNDPA